jgi:hypothetical protein
MPIEGKERVEEGKRNREKRKWKKKKVKKE